MKHNRITALAAVLSIAAESFAAYPVSAADKSGLISVSSFVIHDENFVHLSKGTYLRDVSFLFDEQDKAPASPDNMNVGSEVMKATSKANWTPNQQMEYGPASFYMDMGANYVITAIAFLDTNGTPVWTISDGEPFSWHKIAEQKMDYYNSWRVISFDSPEPTRYLHFSSDYCDSGVSELAIYGYKASELNAAQQSKTAPKASLYPTDEKALPAGKRVGFNAFIDDPMTAMMSAGTIREYHNLSWLLDADCKVKFTQGTWGDMDSYYSTLVSRGISVIPCFQSGSSYITGKDFGDKPIKNGADPKYWGSFSYEIDRRYEYDLKFFKNHALVAITQYCNNSPSAINVRGLYKKDGVLYIVADKTEGNQCAVCDALTLVVVKRSDLDDVSAVNVGRITDGDAVDVATASVGRARK